MFIGSQARKDDVLISQRTGKERMAFPYNEIPVHSENKHTQLQAAMWKGLAIMMLVSEG